MLLCSLPWHLDWHREEKEATARETVSGPSAGGRPRTAEPRGQAPPVLQGPEPGEREGRPAAGAHASAPSCLGARRGQERTSPPHERSPSRREAGRRAVRAQTGTGELGTSTSTPTPQQQRGHLQDPERQAPKESAEQGPCLPDERGLQPPIHSTTSPKEGPPGAGPSSARSADECALRAAGLLSAQGWQCQDGPGPHAAVRPQTWRTVGWGPALTCVGARGRGRLG